MVLSFFFVCLDNLMTIHVEFKRVSSGRFQFFFVWEERVLLSSDPYTEMRSAKRGLRSVKANAHRPLAYLRLHTPDGYCFSLLAKNGRVLAYGSFYPTQADMDADIAVLIKCCSSMLFCQERTLNGTTSDLEGMEL